MQRQKGRDVVKGVNLPTQDTIVVCPGNRHLMQSEVLEFDTCVGFMENLGRRFGLKAVDPSVLRVCKELGLSTLVRYKIDEQKFGFGELQVLHTSGPNCDDEEDFPPGLDDGERRRRFWNSLRVRTCRSGYAW